MDVQSVSHVSAVNISEKHGRRGATKHCAYGLCKSDSRYMDRPGMEGVYNFIGNRRNVLDGPMHVDESTLLLYQ